jgi:hypothetical protein
MFIRKTQIAAGMTAAMLLLSGSAATQSDVQVASAAQRSSGCTAEAAPGGGATAGQDNRSRANRQAVFGNLIGAMVNNAANITAAVAALEGSALQVVCLNDVLNNNDIDILNNVLNDSNVLSNIDILNHADILNNANILSLDLLDDVQILAVDVDTGDVFVLAK